MNNYTRLSKLFYDSLSFSKASTTFQLNTTEEANYEFIVVSSNKSSVCLGDSGSALMVKNRIKNNPFQYKYTVVGVLNAGAASFRNESIEIYCMPNTNSIYIPVLPFMDWIASYVGGNMCIDEKRAILMQSKKNFHLSTSMHYWLMFLSFTLPITMVILPYFIMRTLKTDLGRIGRVKSIFKLSDKIFELEKEQSLELDDLTKSKKKKSEKYSATIVEKELDDAKNDALESKFSNRSEHESMSALKLINKSSSSNEDVFSKPSQN